MEKTYPLSPQQTHLRALQRVAGSGPFRVQCLISMIGPLDRACLKEAIAEIVRRHEILRTSFTGDGEIAETLDTCGTRPRRALGCDGFGLVRDGVENLPDPEQEEKMAALWNQSLQLPLNSTEPLRVTFIACSPLRNFILVSASAFCADLKTVEILAHQLADAYAARQRGESPAGNAVQYGDLAKWQNELLELEDLQAGREYWSRLELQSAAVPKLPFRTSGLPARAGFGFARDGVGETSAPAEFVLQEFTSRLSPDLVLQVRHAAEKYGSSVASFVLACWLVLLGRSSNAQETVIAVACDGRKYEELKDAIGPLTKFLPIVVSFPDGISFAGLLAELDQAVAANHKWQECFHWQHDAPGSPISSFGFEYVSESQPWAGEAVTFKVEKHWSCMDRFRLWLSCEEQNDGLVMHIRSDAHYFHPGEIRWLSERLHAILESAVERPEAQVSDLRILSPAERHKVLVEFNSSVRPLSGLCIHHFFEQQAERTPNALAVMTAEHGLTYGDLNRRANQLARYLRRHGISVESRVAIFMERSLDMFVAVMAVLKAGAAYVPLDSQHPAERISYVLADAAPAILLTQQRLAANLPGSPAKLISIDEHGEAIAREDETNVSVPLVPECLAYVIYTSGSTGAPKGSMISHRALVNHALQMSDLYDLAPGRRMLQFFSLSFDASAEDIFPSLLSGATLVCPPDFFAYSPSELLAFCRRFAISTLHLPVVLWHQLVEEVAGRGSALPHHVRMLSVGGESPSLSKLAIWNQATCGQVSFRNMYGPTETTITASVYQHNGRELSLEHYSRVPIGRPLANVPIYLLDAEMEPVPIGVQGEIYVGGVALARGYVNQPHTTAEKFVPDPFSELPGARLYKTGDLAQFSLHGEIDFLGRIDYQVKIRGYRIELEEIERILLEHPAIKAAAVAVYQNGTGDKRLAAYVTLNSGQSATAKQMRNYLRDRLPEYMSPAWFVVVNALPLTSTGKIDRRALPDPTNENLGPEQEYLAPRNPTEEIVAAIFAELLETEQIGILHNFFEAGGHSLLAVQLASRLRETFQVEVSLKRIFADPTVAGVTAALLEEEDQRLRVERTAELMVKLASVSDDQAETMLGSGSNDPLPVSASSDSLANRGPARGPRNAPGLRVAGCRQTSSRSDESDQDSGAL